MWKQTVVAFAAAASISSVEASPLGRDDFLALVAMPLAVAAVADLADIPRSELVDALALLNAADVHPAQFVEVVRHMPVALVEVETADSPDFVRFVRSRVDEGSRGTVLVRQIEERIRTSGLPDVDLVVTAPRIVDFDVDPIPVVVRHRLAEVKRHPHGGPPGQLKKQLGVQTGAEIVHGEVKEKKEKKEKKAKGFDDDGDGKGKGRDHDDDGDGKGRGKGGGKGKGKD